MDTNTVISMNDVHKSFKAMHVLDGVTLDVHSGETIGIIGQSGVGKSLILKHMIGLMQADSGQVVVNGVDVSQASRSDLERVRARMGFLFQNAALFDSLNVLENVALPLRETTRMSERAIQEKVTELLDQVGLMGSQTKFPPQLSGGMRKRVGLARALVNSPDIVLFDEPTTGLDPVRKNAVHDLIAESKKLHGFTAVVVSHDIPDVFRITDRIAMIDQGKIIVDAPASALDTITNPVFRSFLIGVESIPCPEEGLSRNEFELRLREECSRAQRYGTPFSVVVLRADIPFDEAHAADCSYQLASILRTQMRESDVLGRLDQRSYAMILAETSKQGALSQASRLRERIVAAPGMAWTGEGPRVAVGVSEFTPDATHDQLLLEAVRALK